MSSPNGARYEGTLHVTDQPPKEPDMVAAVVVAEWIKRIADDERKRDAVRAREEDAAARKAQLVRQDGQRLIDDIQATIVRDVETFRGECRTGARRMVLEITESAEGFVISKSAPPAVALAVTPNLEGATIKCRYRFMTDNGLPPREDTFKLVFAADGGDGLKIKHHGTGQLFSTPDALSEFLLVPVFTGRPRYGTHEHATRITGER